MWPAAVGALLLVVVLVGVAMMLGQGRAPWDVWRQAHADSRDSATDVRPRTAEQDGDGRA